MTNTLVSVMTFFFFFFLINLKGGANMRTSQEVTHPSTTLTQTHLLLYCFIS